MSFNWNQQAQPEPQDQFAHLMQGQGQAMQAAANGGNPVSVMTNNFATMPGMDPVGSAMFSGFGAMTDAMFVAAQQQQEKEN
mmetsp:Transcript_6949/g.9608  ORF Transcript_6949/g.9608 Transcript_6949/m.9608 type:complete len:82 (-) Transcript_6949:59-304(-)